MPEFLVRLEVRPELLPPGDLGPLREAESARAEELARCGVLVRLWRTEEEGWRNVGLWRAADRAGLEEVLGSLPFAPFVRWEVEALGAHPSDPDPEFPPPIRGDHDLVTSVDVTRSRSPAQ